MNNILELQNSELEQASREIDESLKYASYLQKSMAPSKKQLDHLLGPHFLFHKPTKQEVSGDFLFAGENSGLTYFGVCDGTGHGVGGALIAGISLSFLNNALEKNCSSPSELLNYAKEGMKNNASSSVVDSGFDGVIFRYNKNNNELIYSSANSPFFINRNGSLIVYEKNPASVSPLDPGKDFFDNKVDLMPGDMLYSFSDGYQDQFGGPKGKKFLAKRFKELLTEIGTYPIEEQASKLENTLYSWKGDEEQIDDITVLGVRF